MVVAVVALGIGAYVFFGGSPNSSQGRQTVDEVPEDRAPASAATTATAVAKTPTPITPPPAAPSASLMLGKPAAVIPPVPAPPKVADTVLPLSTESLDLVLDLDFSEKRSYQNLLGANELAEVTAGELARTSGRGGVWYKGPGAFGRFELTDFVCEVEARLVAATGNHAWGIGLVRKEPPTHPWTGVMLRADGKAGAWLYDEGPFMPWTIVPGLALATTKHTLRVEVRGKIVRVFVNGAFIAEREQSRLQPSTLTLYTSGEAGVDLRVARIRVWKLP
jgi:hypothetical protein